MISSQLHKSKSYILNYEITLKGDKIDENIQSYDFNNRENTADYLLMRISFNSDNFKYSKSSLPYKTYYYSSINTERIYDSSKTEKKIYHIHRLSRKNLLDNFFFIELASCGNEFSYALRDFNKFNDVKDEDFFLNKTDLKHEYKFHHGKKIIEVELKDNSRDLLLIVFPLKLNEKNVCQEINTKTYCDYSYYSDYVIRYRTSKSRIDLEKYKLDKEGS